MHKQKTLNCMHGRSWDSQILSNKQKDNTCRTSETGSDGRRSGSLFQARPGTSADKCCIADLGGAKVICTVLYDITLNPVF